jgi:hypothetical protein
VEVCFLGAGRVVHAAEGCVDGFQEGHVASGSSGSRDPSTQGGWKLRAGSKKVGARGLPGAEAAEEGAGPRRGARAGAGG